MKNSAFQNGYERGQLDALNYKKKDANKGLSFFQKFSFGGISKDTQQYILGYEKGYLRILNDRKKEKELHETLAQKLTREEEETSAKLEEIELRKELLRRTKEIEIMKKQLGKEDIAKDLEL